MRVLARLRSLDWNDDDAGIVDVRLEWSLEDDNRLFQEFCLRTEAGMVGFLEATRRLGVYGITLGSRLRDLEIGVNFGISAELNVKGVAKSIRILRLIPPPDWEYIRETWERKARQEARDARK